MSENVENERNLDYEERTSVAEVYAAAKREKGIPASEGATIPWWCFLLTGALIMLGSVYLGSFNGGFRMDSLYAVANYVPEKRPQIEGAEDLEDIRPWIEKWMADGKKVYSSCIGCHQANGQGLSGAFPPLVASDWVTGGTERLGAIMMSGIQGPFTVNGEVYNGLMPAQRMLLTDRQIAQVMTYIRRSWGNEASVITEEMVKAARATYGDRQASWTEAELLAIPADQMLEGEEPDLELGPAS